MKKFVFPFLLFLIALPGLSQNVNVQVIRNKTELESEWRILDENYQIVFPGSDLFKGDTTIFPLEINKRYYLVVSFYKQVRNIDLYTLYIDKEPIIVVATGIGPGDHLIPFVTGVRAPETKITGGTSTTISEFPWQVLIQAGGLLCGGSIIGSNWILTAAHCTRNDQGNTFSPSQVKVRVGTDNPFSTTTGATYTASAIIPHENYSSTVLANDIALIRLSSPISYPNATPIKLVTREDVSYGAIDPGVMAWISGWGITVANNNNSFPYTLQKLQLPIVSISQALKVWGSIPFSDLMAGYLNGNRDACNGDSGGPLVVPVMGEFKQAGIVSWGSSKCDTYGAYTNVSLFQDWIRSKTGINIASTPPAVVGDTVICPGTGSSSYSTTATTGATNIQWRITPSEAGSVTGTYSSATVTWNTGFSGTAILGYRVTVSGTVSEWSRARIHVAKTTAIIRQSNDTSVCALQPVRLSVIAEGYNNTYRWYHNGVLLSTATTPDISISAASVYETGIYHLEVTGACGSAVSTTIRLTVIPLTKITSFPEDVSVPFGTDYNLNVVSEGDNLIYEWIKDTTVVQSSPSPILILDNANANDIGLYSVIVKGTCGTESRENLYVFVKGNKYPAGQDIFLWPSVTSDFFNLAISSDQLYNVDIYNTMGQKLHEFRNLHYQSVIDVSMLPKGTYIVTVFNKDFRKSLKVIKT
jgi:hypothetical protein